MRYNDWDVVLFPAGRAEQSPLKEFRVACHVVPDAELAHMHGHGSPGLPVVTGFVPSLHAGSPFRISIHSWHNPEISQFTRSYSKHTDLVKFEARVLIDGRLVSSTTFDRPVVGTRVVTNTFEFTKAGELEVLQFPHFRRELQYQNHWSPGDDIGRVKIVISEGFPRDSLSLPFERVKNTVAFSFQHAPLEILEGSGIAWPNPIMWRRPSFNSNMPVPTYQPEDGADMHSHSHSPHRKSLLAKLTKVPAGFPAPLLPSNLYTHASSVGSAFFGSPTTPFQMPFAHPRPSFPPSYLSSDPFNDAYLGWASHTQGDLLGGLGGMSNGGSMGLGFMNMNAANAVGDRRGACSSDTTMADYIPSHESSSAMHLSGPSLDDVDAIPFSNSLKVPTNTPTVISRSPSQASSTTSGLTHSLLNQPLPFPHPQQDHLPRQPLQNSTTAANSSLPPPAPEIKSRKENQRHLMAGAVSNPPSLNSTPRADVQPDSSLASLQKQIPQHETRKVSQPAATLFGMLSLPAVESCDTNAGILSCNTNAAGNNSYKSNSTGSDALTTGATVSFDLPVLSSTSGNAGSSISLGGSASGAGVKRTRNFTPASAKAIDQEDEPRRASPHPRIAGGN